MKIHQVALLSALFFPGCLLGGNGSFESYGCTSSRQVVASQRVDFETTCGGAPCDATTVGRVSIVSSVLPGDHALAIEASSAITWSWTLAGIGVHTAIGLNFRCDDGGSLHLRGDRVISDATAGFDLGAVPTWRHDSWTFSDGGSVFATRDAAQAGHYTAVVELRNTGTARCEVDQVIYAETAEVCVASDACGSELYRDDPLLCGTLCVDPRVDPNNCGACGNVCPSGQHCMSGTCASPSYCLLGCVGRYCGPDECGMGSCGVCGLDDHCTPGGLCAPGVDRDGGTARDGGTVPDSGPTPDAGSRSAVVAGRSCVDDRSCATPSAPLSCVPTPNGGVCTLASGCVPGTPDEDEAQCGGRYSRCLLLSPVDAGLPNGLCTRECIPGRATEAAGACPANAVCTGAWFFSIFGPGSTGCLPFCHADADCAALAGGDAGASVCNVYTGRCGVTAPSLLARPDGSRCDPTSGVDPCRGTCLPLQGARPSEGLCGSFIDRRAMHECPEPDVRATGPSDDDLAVCMAEACDDNAGCRDGLLCVYPEDRTGVRTDYGSPWCAYATALQPTGISRGGGATFDAGMD